MDQRLSRRSALTAGLAAMHAAPAAGAPAEPVRIGIIGLGKRSKKHTAALRQFPNARIVALCDVESERITVANQPLRKKAKSYTDYRELLADKEVDVAVIVTPNYLHAEMTLAAIEAGKDVLVEKPLGITYGQARRVEREARRLERIVAVGMQRGYMSGDQKIVEIVESGRLGDIRFISQNEFIGDWSPETWQYTDPQTGTNTSWRNLRETAGSTLLEFSVHSFGFIQTLLRSPFARVSATGGAVKHPERTTHDVVALLAEFANGVRLQHSHCGFAARARWQLSIIGEKGYLQWDRRELTLQEGDGRPVTTPLRALARREVPEVKMYREFFENVRTRKPSPLGPAFALEASEIAFAADLSIREQRIVTRKDFG